MIMRESLRDIIALAWRDGDKLLIGGQSLWTVIYNTDYVTERFQIGSSIRLFFSSP